jgi:hypothetical protein
VASVAAQQANTLHTGPVRPAGHKSYILKQKTSLILQIHKKNHKYFNLKQWNGMEFKYPFGWRKQLVGEESA